MSTNDTGGGAAAALGTARDEASDLVQTATDSGQDLLHEVKDEAADVVAAATGQARDLFDEARAGLAGQASSQQEKAAASLRSLGDELGRMADGSEQGGLAADLVRQVAGRTGSVATWLEDREPGDVLSEAAAFARRSPGTFLLLAAGAGVLAGRLTRGLKDAPAGGPRPARPVASGPVPAPVPATTEDLSGVLGSTTASPAGTSSGTGSVPTGGVPDARPVDPLDPLDEPAPWSAPVDGEEQAWVASGGDAHDVPAPTHQPRTDEPFSGTGRRDEP